MTLDPLTAILNDLPDPSCIEGTTPLTERFAIALPDGDVGALDDPRFVDWLRAHAEDAPFGDGAETKLDRAVRNAQRLLARGEATIAGFDPTALLPELEAALSPRFHLDAKLEDVVMYGPGGKFARHKDTPRTQDLVGTLVVGLPVAYEGGAFEIIDGGVRRTVDWSGSSPPNALRWVALFSDIDHAIEEVTGGTRVTLVYSLARSSRARADATRDTRLAKLRDAVAGIAIAEDAPLLIPCTRLIVTNGEQPQSLDTLRGTDREIADVFAEAGFAVAVRTCIVGGDDESEVAPGMLPPIVWGVTRLGTAIPEKVRATMGDAVSFTEEADDDETEGFEATLLGEYIADIIGNERVAVRKRAAATVIYDGLYSETGYFGNEASFGQIYMLAALEVTPAGPK